jgi:2-haloacid dehalogenase
VSYKHILMDLDNTLYDTRQTEKKAMSVFLKHYAPLEDSAELYPVYKRINHQLWRDLETGDVMIDEINEERFRRFFTKQGIDADAKEAGDYYLDLLCKYHIFYPAAQEIYEYLTKKYQVALITNGLRAAQERRIQNTFLQQDVTPLYIGEVIGWHKPAPEVVDHIMMKENWTDKEQVIIIGDSLSSDIQCAQNAGITSIWCNFTAEDQGSYKPDYTVTELLDIKNLL